MKASIRALAAARLNERTVAAWDESPAVLQAKVDFFEALVSRNAREAKRACAVMGPYAKGTPPLTPAAQAKQDRRTAALMKWVCAERKRREEEARGVIRPTPTPEQVAAGREAAERFKRWLAGDDSAGPFE